MNNFSLYQDELIAGQFHPKVNAYYFKQWQSHQMPFHSHKEVEIMYVIDGKCTVETEDKRISMKKGDFILLDANVPHRLTVEKSVPCRMLNIEFSFVQKQGSFPAFKELVAENKSLTQLLALSYSYIVLKDPNEIYHTLKNLVLEMDKKGSENEMLVQILLAQLLIQIARMVVEEKEKDCEFHQANIYVKKAIEFLHQNYDCDIQIKDVGKAVNLHPGYLHRIFKNQMDCSIMEYLTSHRMEKAKMLLTDTDIPIIEISHYVGINSRQYFSLLFKKYTNKTPLEFRKSVLKNIVKYSS
ncbi:AraC family transcriptional regulator [Metabacillus bambusae]|uniref:AraC family transcriptional regulator n=1 Tax=Metabacillus bambusae TaxID=2795218 RepID=A0ABS3MWQ6_9BACI|nr:AraC family transcriptional regulator [Metabacillus bambusae]MBO1510280.1 AraC family transcriptional regulator [Metabacillus bambusae]